MKRIGTRKRRRHRPDPVNLTAMLDNQSGAPVRYPPVVRQRCPVCRRGVALDLLTRRDYQGGGCYQARCRCGCELRYAMTGHGVGTLVAYRREQRSRERGGGWTIEDELAAMPAREVSA